MDSSEEYARIIAQFQQSERERAAWVWFFDHARYWRAKQALDNRRSLRLRHEYGCKPKQCYYNAQKIALDNLGAEYWEGFACAIIPVDHAWLVINGKVVDPTWASYSRKYPVIDYFGVHVPAARIRKHWLDHGNANALAFRYALECTASEHYAPRDAT